MSRGLTTLPTGRNLPRKLAAGLSGAGRVPTRRLGVVVNETAADRFLRSRRRGGESVARGVEADRRVVGFDRWKRRAEVGLVLLSSPGWLPLLGLIGLAVRLDSSGPALFFQRRYGWGGRKFTLVKFRTMQVDAHEALADHLAADAQHAFEWAEHRKMKNDPRVTRVGRFLRRTSLDELPQLWNVLMGEMSLVGPRPLPVCERKTYGARGFSTYGRVRPGLTGLWQVSGRSDLPYGKRIALDTFYVQKRGWRLDGRVLWRTVGAVWSARGAY